MPYYFVLGVNRFFQMICIHEKLNNASSKKIPISDVWKHLGEMYDLMALVSYCLHLKYQK